MQKLPIRFLKYIAGLFIMTIGISIAIKSSLGSPPVSAFPYTLTLITGLEMGIGTMLFQSFFVILQILILRRDFALKNLLQVLVSVVFGRMTTFSNSLMALLPDPESMVLRILMIFASCFLIALGIALYVPANLVPMPTEGFVKTVAEKTDKAFGSVKIVFDCLFVTVSAVLCLIFTRTFGSIGVGTVILAIFVGLLNKQIIRFFHKMSAKKA